MTSQSPDLNPVINTFTEEARTDPLRCEERVKITPEQCMSPVSPSGGVSELSLPTKTIPHSVKSVSLVQYFYFWTFFCFVCVDLWGCCSHLVKMSWLNSSFRKWWCVQFLFYLLYNMNLVECSIHTKMELLSYVCVSSVEHKGRSLLLISCSSLCAIIIMTLNDVKH